MNDKKNGSDSIATRALSSKSLQVFLTVAGVAVAILNLWIASILAPLIKDIAVVSTQVKAAQEDIQVLRDSRGDLISRDEWTTRNTLIDTSLGRMEGKMDSIILQYSK